MEWKKIIADIERMDSFSAHADQKEMIDFFANQKPGLKKMMLVHGDYDAQKHFKHKLHEEGYKDVHIPDMREVVEL